jgi:hypothetical protein
VKTRVAQAAEGLKKSDDVTATRSVLHVGIGREQRAVLETKGPGR